MADATQAADTAAKTVDQVSRILGNVDSSSVMSLMSTFSDKLSEVVHKYGADAVNLFLTVIQLKAGANLFMGFLFIFISILVYKYGIKRLWIWAPKREQTNSYNNGDSYLVAGVASAAWATISFMVIQSYLFDFFSWVAVINPKAGLVWLAISKIINI